MKSLRKEDLFEATFACDRQEVQSYRRFHFPDFTFQLLQYSIQKIFISSDISGYSIRIIKRFAFFLTKRSIEMRQINQVKLVTYSAIVPRRCYKVWAHVHTQQLTCFLNCDILISELSKTFHECILKGNSSRI